MPDDDVVTLLEYRALLADARAMVVALVEADVTLLPVPEGNPPLQDSEIGQFDHWRDQAVKNWDVMQAYLQAGDPHLVRAGLYILEGDLTYPLSDVRSDWDDLAPDWSTAYFTFTEHLERLQDKTSVGHRPAARESVMAYLPTLSDEFRPIVPR